MEIYEQNQTMSDLPSVAFGKRAIPNDLIRSSLFSVRNHSIRRDFFKEKELFAFGNTRITFTGEELRQDDEDVWLQLIYLMSKDKSYSFEFKPYTLLSELEWPGRTQYRDKLKSCINRMSATNLTISNKDYSMGLSVSLIRKFVWKDEKGDKLKNWTVWLEPEILKLFEGFKFTKIDWLQRLKLSPLSKWLHSFYSSHKEPYPIKVETLRAASGSSTKNLKHFRAALRKALQDLVQVGLLEEYFIDKRDLVNVVRVKRQQYIYFDHD